MVWDHVLKVVRLGAYHHHREKRSGDVRLAQTPRMPSHHFKLHTCFVPVANKPHPHDKTVPSVLDSTPSVLDTVPPAQDKRLL